jgi:hypothetical protein
MELALDPTAVDALEHWLRVSWRTDLKLSASILIHETDAHEIPQENISLSSTTCKESVTSKQVSAHAITTNNSYDTCN